MKPAISVGLQYFNNKDTIAYTLESLLNQTFKDFEIILHDDGSTDSSTNIVRSFNDQRIRLFVDKRNKKRPFRLNQSIALAEGRYYAVADADDIYYPERLERQLRFLEDNPKVDLVGGRMLVFSGQGFALGKRVPPQDHESICRYLWRGVPMAQPTFMGRIEWFRQFRYQEDIPTAEDQNILLRAAKNSRYANLDQIVVGYREDELRMRKIYSLRVDFIKGGLRFASKEKRYITGAMMVVSEITKTLLDCLALFSRFEYQLLSHRAAILTREDAFRWGNLYQEISVGRPNEQFQSAEVSVTSAPLVSVGMQYYNNQSSLEAAIDSILRQTYRNFELLLHDDGSTDASTEIVKKFNDPRIRHFKGDRNRRRPYRLNQSLSEANGYYYMVADADDISYPERIAKQVEFLTRHPDVDLVGSAMLVYAKDGRILGKRQFPERHDDICKYPWLGIRMAQPTFMGKTNWFRAYKYNVRFSRAQDLDLLLRTHVSSRFHNLAEILVGYNEPSLRLWRLTVDRRFALKATVETLWRFGYKRNIAIAVLAQTVKWVLDGLAIGSGLKYKLLRQRATKVSEGEAVRWRTVYGDNRLV